LSEKKIQEMFATVNSNAPLHNQKEISNAFLHFDEFHLVREIEAVLLRGSVLTVLHEENGVCEIVTEEYPSVKPLYIDKRFINKLETKPESRKKTLSSKKVMIERLLTVPALPYIWGGNVPEGIPSLLSLYPPKRTLSTFEYFYWQLKGVDCSGLLYWLTSGSSPRNTAEIILTYPEVKSLKPLDLIAWKGHVLIALPNNQVIESRQYDGIVRSDLTNRLKEIEQFEPRYFRFF
jgi:hypothetical protein